MAQFITELQYEDNTVAAGSTYYYWVRTRNGLGAGPFSTSDTGFVPVPPIGGLIWSFSAGPQVHSSPAVATDGTVYVASAEPGGFFTSSHFLYAINPNFTVKWSLPLGGPVFSSPAVAPDGTIYVGCGDSKLYAVKPDGTPLWDLRFSPGAWTGAAAVGSTPAVGSDGTIYLFARDGFAYAVNPDGTLKWFYSISQGFDSQGLESSPLIGADGIIYFAAGWGLYALHADGTLLWRYAVDKFLPSRLIYARRGQPFAVRAKRHAVGPAKSGRRSGWG